MSSVQCVECIGATGFYSSAATVTISGLICLIALAIILDNHVRATFWSKFYDNLSLLKPGTVATLWSVAKWSGIVSASALGTFLLSAAYLVSAKRK